MKFYWLYHGRNSARIIVMDYPTDWGKGGCRVYCDNGYSDADFGEDFIITKGAYYTRNAASVCSYEEMRAGLSNFLIKEML